MSKNSRSLFQKLLGVLLALWLVAPAARSEKIPALAEVPRDLPAETLVDLSKARGDLGAEYRSFKTDSDAFNALPANAQNDATYNALLQRRADHISRVKAFNARVAVAVGRNIVLQEIARSPSAVAAAVRGQCFIQLDDGTLVPIDSGSKCPITGHVHVVTKDDSRLQLLLPDETVFTLGPNADMILDKFVYEPDNPDIAGRITRGAFRWITGRIARRNEDMNVRLNVAVIGIRGTDFEVSVNPDGSAWVRLYSGRIDLNEVASDKKTEMKERQQTFISSDGKIGAPASMLESEAPEIPVDAVPGAAPSQVEKGAP